MINHEPSASPNPLRVGRLMLASVSVSLLILASCSADRDPHSNQLADATSPYLREHADNPVHWREWSKETLALAASENKPIIISIGYASCHWCHVMERESFMDTAVARVMNENYICIKVDREERPDLDQVYIHAAELTSGNAGWPLNAFALPDGRPIYAATYYPKDYWTSLLSQVLTAFKDDPDNLVKQATAIQSNIQQRDSIDFGIKPPEVLAKDFLDAVPAWTSYLDLKNGGLKGGTKFPMPSIAEFMLQYQSLAGHSSSAGWLHTTLREIAYGGIYDQIGGGFCRYATDSTWRVPHFEKMLYDNGQLVSLYAHAFQATGDSLYIRIVNETLGFVATEMTSPEGAFYSSINADSEGEEGKYYVWSEEEVRNVIDQQNADAVISTFGITAAGNWQSGRNIPYVGEKQRDEGVLRALARDKEVLLMARAVRTRPSTDEKVLASWNAIMLKGYVDAYRAGGHPDHLQSAIRNANFISENLIADNGKLRRAYLKGESGVDGFLEDYAWVALAYIHLYQVTFDRLWLDRARQLADVAVKEFGSPDNAMFYFASAKLSNPVSRKMEIFDNVMPASNSVFAEVLFYLGEYFQNDAYLTKSKAVVAQALRKDAALGLYVANWARLAQIMDEQPYEVAIAGDKSTEYALQLQKKYLPTALFMGGTKENLPLLENKLKPGSTVIYVCRNRVCKLPTEDIKKALEQLGQN